MTAPLNDLLQHVLQGEPELGDEVDAVFRRADRLRRLRTRALLGAGAAAVAVIAAAGYLLAVTLLPAGTPNVAGSAPPAAAPSAVATPSATTDQVLPILAPLLAEKDLEIRPRVAQGDGWRQYSVLDSAGEPRGTVDVAMYHLSEDLCFPVRDAPDDCAHTEWAPRGVEFVRYDDEQDPDWQVHQTIARRISDGRTVAVMATGERNAGGTRGKPALSGKKVEEVATDQRLFDAFGPDEHCTGRADAACPAFKVPVPTKTQTPANN